MSEIDTIISSNILHKIGEMVITDVSWKMIYRNHGLSFSDEQWEKWAGIYREDIIDDSGVEWEIADKDNGQFYKVHTFMIRDRDDSRLIHHVYDISDYAEMFRELSVYSREWRTVADCQSDIICSLSDSPEDCLTIALKYLKGDIAVLYVERRGVTIRYMLRSADGSSIDSSVVTGTDYMGESGKVVNRPDLDDTALLCCCSGHTTAGTGYALYLSTESEIDSRVREMLYNEFMLSIENALLREQVSYENEHDALTGLYNRGKYADMMKNVFPFYDSIAVYNMDVNYLKRTNDTMGHEMGNKLILKTAGSIKAVQGDDVYGFRVGGDEFLMVAGNVSEQEAQKIRETWQAALDEINSRERIPECVIACGMVFGTKPYNVDEIFREADRLMYEDKVAIKIARGEDPDSR